MPGTKAGAAKRWRCPDCGGLHRRDGTCVKAGPKKYTTDELIERGRRIEANGCHSFRGKRGRYPTAGAPKVRIARYLLGLDGPLVTRHTCDNDWCINPEHLIPGTQAQNLQDARERGRR